VTTGTITLATRDPAPELEHIKTDVAFVPIGGTYTMGASEAAGFIKKIRPQLAVPMHYGFVVGSPADAETFARESAPCQGADAEAGACLRDVGGRGPLSTPTGVKDGSAAQWSVRGLLAERVQREVRQGLKRGLMVGARMAGRSTGGGVGSRLDGWCADGWAVNGRRGGCARRDVFRCDRQLSQACVRMKAWPDQTTGETVRLT